MFVDKYLRYSNEQQLAWIGPTHDFISLHKIYPKASHPPWSLRCSHVDILVFGNSFLMTRLKYANLEGKTWGWLWLIWCQFQTSARAIAIVMQYTLDKFFLYRCYLSFVPSVTGFYLFWKEDGGSKTRDLMTFFSTTQEKRHPRAPKCVRGGL